MYNQEMANNIEELEERLTDLSEKTHTLDNHFNRKNFSLVCEGHEIHLENFLAKHVLKAIRGALVQELITHQRIQKQVCVLDDSSEGSKG
jgi:hypothetical protein